MTTVAEEKNGASAVTRARENPPSRKSAEHYWAGGANPDFPPVSEPVGGFPGAHAEGGKNPCAASASVVQLTSRDGAMETAAAKTLLSVRNIDRKSVV